MKILVINAGSSSLKYQLFDMETESVLAKGLCERITVDGHIKHTPNNGKPVYEADIAFPSHAEAMEAVLKILVDTDHGVINSTDEIDAVGHRVLHGGAKFTESCIVNEACKEAIRACFPLGPLHNPANLMGIEACETVMPGKPQIAVFDTAFGMSMPATAYMYALPYEYYEKHALRRYGFHGTSHRFVALRIRQILNKEGDAALRHINCHLGNGSSCSAVVGGKCVDTTMGLTPLAGVPMGTRSGDIDPSLIEFIMEQEGLTLKQTMNVLNKKSGMIGLSGVSPDFRDLEKAANEGNERAALALDKFAYEVRKYIGAYAAAMGGVDVITFTAGVGENSATMRSRIMKGLEYLGAKLDTEKNAVCRSEGCISTADSSTLVYVVPTNEELMIARDTMELAAK